MTPVTTTVEAPDASAGAASLTIEIFEIGGGLADEVKAASGASPMSCYQCAKCSSGCPVADRGDLKPHELVRLVQTGQRGAVLSSRFIWECTSCYTCITRCPQKVDIPAMNDALRAFSLDEGVAVAGTAVPVFNEIFLKSVRKRGRVHELSLMAAFKLRSRRLFDDVDKAPAMLAKGKLPLLGSHVGDRKQREELFRKAVAEASRAAAEAAAEPATAEAPAAKDGGS
jgi:heterodisulfide reductase subunit C2